jgi:alkylation response protein AidB-like acyl-CoA dehydrogenase
MNNLVSSVLVHIAYRSEGTLSFSELQGAGRQIGRVCWNAFAKLSTQDYMNYNRQIALLKMYTTKASQETARDAVQIFGGRGITASGMGQYIEHVGLCLIPAVKCL